MEEEGEEKMFTLAEIKGGRKISVLFKLTRNAISIFIRYVFDVV